MPRMVSPLATLSRHEFPLDEPPSLRKLPTIGDCVGGRYRLVDTLGEGQFGRVYRAERTDLSAHHVALKVLASQVYDGRDAEQELRLLSAVAHPHIVQLADHGVERDHVWFTMPLYLGEPLDAVIARRPLTAREAFEVFAPIADGLEVLHAVGLRHQDVKPENIFLASFQRNRFPLLLDLGAAAPIRAPHPAAGTLLYAAPEQRRALLACLRGEIHHEELSERVDTYNLAATLLHALVGGELFPGHESEAMEDAAEVDATLERAALERAVRPLRAGALRDLPAPARQRLAETLTCWLAFDPEKRPTMKQFRAQLEVLLEGDAQRQQQRHRRRVVAWTLGATMLVGAAAGGLQRRKEMDLQRCTNDLVSHQQQALEQVSSLDQCKGLLGAQTLAGEQCQGDRRSLESKLREVSALPRGDEGAWWQARYDRCEGERKATLTSCNADIEALVREQTAISMERDLLRSERDQLRSGRARPAAPLASAPTPVADAPGAVASAAPVASATPPRAAASASAPPLLVPPREPAPDAREVGAPRPARAESRPTARARRRP